MPQIIVTAGDSADLEGTITLRERINTSDFESERFAVNLLERLGWAVGDAAEAETRPSNAKAETRPPRVHDELETDEVPQTETAPELVKA